MTLLDRCPFSITSTVHVFIFVFFLSLSLSTQYNTMYENEKESIELGIIGAGGMGRFYAQTISKAGWKK